MMKPLVMLSPTAILGYGFPATSLERGLSFGPDVIAVDAGSTDPGPFYLGSGKSFVPRKAVKRDLGFLIRAARALRVPLLIGTAGGSGARPHLDWCWEILLETAAEEGLSFRLAVIAADVSKQYLDDALREGRVKPLGPAPELTAEAIQGSTYLVAQMGVSPLIEALDGGADVVLAGRCYDPAVFAALPVRYGYPAGLALHLGKILECAAIAATPGSGSDCMIGILEGDRFLVEPAGLGRLATIASVAAHTLYEKSNPYLLPGPGGSLDLRETTFEQINERRVAVSGTRYRSDDACSVKVEGARLAGYRVVSIAGARDPSFISALDAILDGARERTRDNFRDEPEKYTLIWHVYGRDGVMGRQEPHPAPGHEIGIVMEAVAETREMAEAVLGFARSTLLHYGYPGRLCTAGNLAFPYSPSDFPAGEAYEFSVHHLVTMNSPTELFPVVFEEVRA
jgi:hypothetical protein